MDNDFRIKPNDRDLPGNLEYRILLETFDIQQDYILNKNTESLLESVLKIFLKLTNSQDGFIAEITNEYINPVIMIGKRYNKTSISPLLKLSASIKDTSQKYKLFLQNSEDKTRLYGMCSYIPIMKSSTKQGKVVGLIGSNNLYKLKFLDIFNPMTILCEAIINRMRHEKNIEMEKGSLISYIGHEFKTSLTTTIGFTNLLKYSKSSGGRKEYMKLIEQSNIELISLVNNTVDYSKLLLNKIKLSFSICNIKKCMTKISRIMKKITKQNNLKIRYNIDCSLLHDINIDVEKFQQLLINVLTSISSILINYDIKGIILVNCCRLNLSNTDRLCIKISLNMSNYKSIKIENIRIRLSDKLETPGINNKIHEGIDLNLQIAKKLSNLFGGTIKIENDNHDILCIYLTEIIKVNSIFQKKMNINNLLNDRHCLILSDDIDKRIALYSYFELLDITCNSFSTLKEMGYFMKRIESNKLDILELSLVMILTDFDLPKTFISKTGTIIRIDSWSTKEIEKNDFVNNKIIRILNKEKSNIKILLVEDNKAHRRILTDNIKSLGWKNINIVDDGKQAVEIVNKQDFDIIFMDINMPIMDGITAFNIISKKFKKCTRKPYIIGLTAFTDSALFIRSHMDDYISKPAEISQLENALQRYLQSKKE